MSLLCGVENNCGSNKNNMDYVVGSVAALISGNVTPNRPKRLKKAATPMKHQPSPNVTPKSEFVDRSIFLSPSMQKKKAIVKKSPKRIFQNPDLDVTKEDEESSTVTSPKADKVKKHLIEELDANSVASEIMLSPKSPNDDQKKEPKSPSSKKKINLNEGNVTNVNDSPSKKRKRRKSVADRETLENHNENIVDEKENIASNVDATEILSPKKKAKKSKLVSEEVVEMEPDTNTNDNLKSKKKNKNKSNQPPVEQNTETISNELQSQSPKKKNKKRKNKKQKAIDKVENNDTNLEDINNKDTTDDKTKIESTTEDINEQTTTKSQSKKKNKKRKNKKISNDNIESVNVNANAITNKDTDSEHESDDEIESEDDEINKKSLETAPPDSSEDESEDVAKNEKNVAKTEAKKETHVATEDEVKKTIFVGNVPFSSKCKKEIKKIFSEYGQIETVR